MADRDDSQPSSHDEDSKSRNRERSGLTFRLPPIRLPPFFPEDFRIAFPIPGRPRQREVSTGAILAACLLFDLADAALALTVSPSIAGVRAVLGTFLAATIAGPLGVLYVWEVAAVLAGFSHLTVVPTLTLLVVLRALR